MILSATTLEPKRFVLEKKSIFGNKFIYIRRTEIKAHTQGATHCKSHLKPLARYRPKTVPVDLLSGVCSPRLNLPILC